MVARLGPKLSPNATIYFEGSQEFGVLTERWQLYAPPNFIAVVDVQTAEDVQKTVSPQHVMEDATQRRYRSNLQTYSGSRG